MPSKRKSTEGATAELDTPATKRIRETSTTSILDQNIDVFGRHLQSKTFIFLVGPEKARFEIHESTLASSSVVFDRMMNGNMREARKGMAVLPAAEPAIFARFAQFCYTGDYPVMPRETRQLNPRFPLPKPNCDTLGLQILRRSGKDASYTCAISVCDEVVHWQERPAIYPYCSIECAQMAIGSRIDDRCIFCRRATTLDPSSEVPKFRTIANICFICVEDHLNIDWPIQSVTDLTESSHKAKRLTSFYETLKSDTATCDKLKKLAAARGEPSADLLSHAKLYVMAEMYDVASLKSLCLTRLCYDLSHFDLDSETVPLIAELAEYVYMSTSEEQQDAILRHIVTAYIAHDAMEFMVSPHAPNLFQNVTDFAIDLADAMATF